MKHTVALTLFLIAETIVLFYAVSLWFIPILIYLALVLWASFSICSQFFTPTICKNKNDGIVLSFDDGPHEIYTEKILKILKKHNIHALFFVVGKEVEKRPEILQKIVDGGHTIGIHTFSHSPFFAFFSAKKMQREISEAIDLIDKTCGVRPSIFRPPAGVTNPPLAKTLRILNLTTIGWSFRSFDTLFSNRTTLLNRLIKGTKP
ncbi:polysaccharide deacetylase family protein, partial [bacterium]|nr:polysaccharide deacetylase family protein [bacterium]